MMPKLVLVAAVSLIMTSCGSESVRTSPPPYQQPGTTPTPNPNPAPGGDKSADFVSKAVPIIKKSCVGCHASDAFTQSLAGWQSSKAKEEVGSSSMPPPGSAASKAITTADRAVLTSF